MAVAVWPLHAQTGAPDTSGRLRLEAEGLAMWADTGLFVPETLIQETMSALTRIRARYPRLADIRAGGSDHRYLVLYPADSVSAAFIQRSRARRPAGDALRWRTNVAATGFPAIDTLNRRLGVHRVELEMLGDRGTFRVHFSRPVNTWRASRLYDRVPQVSYAGEEMQIGGGSYIAVLSKPGRMLFLFARGGGDCPSGCTEWDYYYVSYDRASRRARLERTYSSIHPMEEPIFHWDIPSRNSINPYPTVDSIYRGMRSARWWYRAHATRVLGTLLGPDTGPWRGAGEQSPEHFSRLKAGALRDRVRALNALIDRLVDPDPDVAASALAVLRQVTGHPGTGGAAGQPGWRARVAAPR